ncbi:MAG: 2'-5' RNA ligase family protein [Nitrosopumilus sp. D6]|nr:MAG: 2'-5' RNA ligase family protein [Nitrosopumilus sp. D6]
MRYPYLVEFRLCGEPRRVARGLILEIYKRFRVTGNVKRRPVPHVTLYGPFQAGSARRVAESIREAARGFGPFGYGIDGFDSFDKKTGWFSRKRNVVYLGISAGSDMKRFRSRLHGRLAGITRPKDPAIERKDPFPFHVTLAIRDIDEKFDEIWQYLMSADTSISGEFCGITLLRDGKILCEYDLESKRLLGRRQALRRRCAS